MIVVDFFLLDFYNKFYLSVLPGDVRYNLHIWVEFMVLQGSLNSDGYGKFSDFSIWYTYYEILPKSIGCHIFLINYFHITVNVWIVVFNLNCNLIIEN